MKYYIVDFDKFIGLSDQATVIDCEITESGTRTSSRASNRALVQYPDDFDDFICGAETAGGYPCGRIVQEPQDTCGQH